MLVLQFWGRVKFFKIKFWEQIPIIIINVEKTE